MLILYYIITSRFYWGAHKWDWLVLRVRPAKHHKFIAHFIWCWGCDNANKTHYSPCLSSIGHFFSVCFCFGFMFFVFETATGHSMMWNVNGSSRSNRKYAFFHLAMFQKKIVLDFCFVQQCKWTPKNTPIIFVCFSPVKMALIAFPIKYTRGTMEASNWQEKRGQKINQNGARTFLWFWFGQFWWALFLSLARVELKICFPTKTNAEWESIHSQRATWIYHKKTWSE